MTNKPTDDGYFSELFALAAEAGASSGRAGPSQEALAQFLLSLQTFLARVRSLSPPKDCQEAHARLLAYLAREQSLLNEVSEGAGGDPGQAGRALDECISGAAQAFESLRTAAAKRGIRFMDPTPRHETGWRSVDDSP